jgi:hypothetical protein
MSQLNILPDENLCRVCLIAISKSTETVTLNIDCVKIPTDGSVTSLESTEQLTSTRHFFHTECLNDWIESNTQKLNYVCPNCNTTKKFLGMSDKILKVLDRIETNLKEKQFFGKSELEALAYEVFDLNNIYVQRAFLDVHKKYNDIMSYKNRMPPIEPKGIVDKLLKLFRDMRILFNTNGVILVKVVKGDRPVSRTPPYLQGFTKKKIKIKKKKVAVEIKRAVVIEEWPRLPPPDKPKE